MNPRPEPVTPSDAALVEAYRAGDQSAATLLVARHATPLGRFLVSSGVGPNDAEDLVQEALFRAFRRIETWRAEASFRSWLFTIASNLVKDEYRKRRGRLMVSIEDRDLPDHSDPAATLEAKDAEERLAEGLTRLPRLQREVFLLRVNGGVEYQEIAATLGTTPGAARVHFHHAVKRLKELVR